MKIAVLVSGHGSNLQALIDAGLATHMVGVLSNQADAYALQRATQAQIPTAVISHKDFPNRVLFDQQMHQQLLAWQADFVVLAGFMRILSDEFVRLWQGKMINIHPSLLPYYKGMHTHQRVLRTGDVFHGCTAHFVTPELDSGCAVAQGVLKVKGNETAEQLAERVHQLEHLIYPQVVQWICQGQIQHQHDGSVHYMGKPLTQPLRFCDGF
ncbi:MAG: phosphoribosylglycinamide formyltransferase [Acinetobacter sp.]|nr:phosphoribosylglycinamide formyltransferase [Acinetobacter sp.]